MRMTINAKRDPDGHCTVCGILWPDPRETNEKHICPSGFLIPPEVESPLRESDIARTCSDYLACDGWRPLRMETVYNERYRKGTGERGMTDKLFIRYAMPVALPIASIQRVHAEVVWIEWKRLDRRGKATKAAPHQRAWHAAERARGALVWVAGEDFEPTIEAFQNFYRASGLDRGRG